MANTEHTTRRAAPALPRAVLLALLATTTCATAQLAVASPCPPPRDHPPGVAWFVESGQNWAYLLQSLVGYEGDEPDARPLPQASHRDLAEDLEASLRGSKRTGKPIHPRALFFTFYTDRAPDDEPEVIEVSRSDIWCLTRAGDIVLLSDGVTHHTTRIARIDREESAVYLLDPWPARFFMLQGKNVRGYTASIVPISRKVAGKQIERNLLRVEMSQYLKVVAGLITVDTPDLIGYYFTINPDAKANPRTQLAFGTTLLHWGNNRFVDDSTEFLESARDLAARSADDATAETAASRLNVALMLDFYHASRRQDRAVANQRHVRLTSLWNRYGRDSLLAMNRPVDDYRIGLSAGNAGALDEAIYFFTRSIQRAPTRQVAYLYRGVAKEKKHDDPAGVVQDTTRALELNGQERAALAESISNRHPRDEQGKARDAGTRIRLDEWETLARQIRGPSLLRLERPDLALEDGRRLIELQPESSKGYALVGFGSWGMGRLDDARISLARAVQLEKEPPHRSVLRKSLADLERVAGNQGGSAVSVK